MKKAVLWAPLPLAFIVVLLILNVRERSEYEFGTVTPPAAGNNVPADDAAFLQVLPELRIVHPCSGCGECVHPFEIVENRRVISLHNRSGWYRLFWASNRDYYYTDPVHLFADWARNRTAEAPRGLWRIRLRAGPATHQSAPAHGCGQIPRELVLGYELVLSEEPIEEFYFSGDGPLRIPKSFSWLVTDPGKPMSLGWRLVGDPKVDAGPCPCARP